MSQPKCSKPQLTTPCLTLSSGAWCQVCEWSSGVWRALLAADPRPGAGGSEWPGSSEVLRGRVRGSRESQWVRHTHTHTHTHTHGPCQLIGVTMETFIVCGINKALHSSVCVCVCVPRGLPTVKGRGDSCDWLYARPTTHGPPAQVRSPIDPPELPGSAAGSGAWRGGGRAPIGP